MTHVKVKNQYVPGIFNLMDRFFGDEFETSTGMLRPAVNIVEVDNAYQLQLMAPGLQKSDFKITVEKDQLIISYDKQESQEEATDKFVRREFVQRSFKRSFSLNDKLNVDAIRASYENGILIISIPKAEVKSVEVRSIDIN